MTQSERAPQEPVGTCHVKGGMVTTTMYRGKTTISQELSCEHCPRFPGGRTTRSVEMPPGLSREERERFYQTQVRMPRLECLRDQWNGQLPLVEEPEQ